MKILPILLLISLLSGCSETITSQESIENQPTITSVTQGCSMFEIEMTTWKSSNNDGVYRCISNYIEISSGDGIRLPNNLAYYVQGTKNTVNELKIVLNVHNKNYKKKAKDEFLAMSEKTYKNIKSHELPEELKIAISSKNNYSMSDENLVYSIENDVFKDNKGFTQKFIIRLK